MVGRLAFGLAAAASLVVGSAPNAEAYEVKRTSKGDLVHWDEASVPYTLDPSIERSVRSGETATSSAMEAWSGTVGAPELRVRARDASSPGEPGYDEKNGVFFVPGGYEAAGHALAITILTYDNGSGRILDADIVFNGIYDFAVLPAPEDLDRRYAHPSNTDGITHDEQEELVSGATYDLPHVVAHELGHSLGMNDEHDNDAALMYRYSAPNDATLRQPASDDIAGLAELYGTRLAGQGGGCGSTVAPTKPGRTANGWATVAALGFLAYLGVRARRDRKARVAFVAMGTLGLVAALPAVSARASAPLSAGHARARITATSTVKEHGLFRTQYALATETCRSALCPSTARGASWGGTIGNVTQDVGNAFAPRTGDEVDVSFAKLPSALGSLKPLAGRPVLDGAAVRVVTKAR